MIRHLDTRHIHTVEGKVELMRPLYVFFQIWMFALTAQP